MKTGARAVFVIAVAVAGCGGAGGGAPTGRVDVVAVVGPTCTAVSDTDTTGNCDDRPYADGVVEFTRGSTSTLVQLDAQGHATADLGAGVWDVRGDPAVPMPTCGPVTVEVTADATVTVTLVCDSGIR